MKHYPTGAKRGRFQVLTSTSGSQAAMMTLAPGAATGSEPDNEHPRSEQWLFVISGTGEAVIGGGGGARRRVKLRDNSLLLIEKGEPHQIKNTGRRMLRTINFYVPPAYDAEGNPK
jgi:mannose-6-phosphate isomerase-like protein (cupin superfamily)